MAEKDIIPGVYKIVSNISDKKPPTSVNLTLPGWQTVYLNGPVTTWVVRKEGDKYLLSLGGYPFTGIEHETVTATIHQDQNVKWVADYQEHAKAYIISPAGKEDDLTVGWTVADDSEHAKIDIRPVIIGLSDPPHISPGQLFQFERVHG